MIDITVKRVVFALIALWLGTVSVARAQESTQVLQLPQLPGPIQEDAPTPLPLPPTEEPPLFEVPRFEPKVEPKPELPVSPNTGMPVLPQPEPLGQPRPLSMAEHALTSGDYYDPRYICNSLHPDDPGAWTLLREGYGDQIHRLWSDYQHFYWSRNLIYVGISILIAAPIANTQADREFREWYESQAGHGRSRGVDRTAHVFREFGEFRYTLPVYFAASLGGHLFPDHSVLAPLGEFGDRSLRALAVGAPTVGVLQVTLGTDRPESGHSRWIPFRSRHAVSGHTFVGAVPFLTAASMVDNPALKAAFYAGSVATGWSRIHEDRHYLSQVILGWCIAYLSVESVNWTECERSRIRVVPVEFPRGMGMGVQIDY